MVGAEKASTWKGAGLGSQESGIVDPVSGGEVRDRSDQFKGVGVAADRPRDAGDVWECQAGHTRWLVGSVLFACARRGLRVRVADTAVDLGWLTVFSGL